jgi:transposase
MALSYLPVDRAQQFLLPPDMGAWLPEGHLVWLVVEVVERLDTSGLHAVHGRVGVGRRAYDPDMLLALLIYAYCTGVRSSRRIERLCEVDVAYRVICAGWIPDHSTIARFRQGCERVAVRLFAEVLAVCAQAGLARVGVVAVDGTKMEADASMRANRSRAQLEAEVAAMFAQAETIDDEEDGRFGDGRGDELPVGLRDRGGRAARLAAALREVEAQEAARRAAEAARGASGQQARGGSRRGRRRADEEVAQAVQALANVEAELAAPDSPLARVEAELAAAVETAAARQRANRTARGKLMGRPRKTPGGRTVARKQAQRDRQAALAERRRRHAQARLDKARGRAAERAIQAKARRAPTANVTDPDSRIMKTAGGWVQGYNAQSAVNTCGVVLAATVTQDHNDVAQCIPMMAAVEANLAAADVAEPVGTMLFDAGYLSEDNLTATGPDRLIATAKTWQLRRAAKADGYTIGDPPPDASPIEAMEHRLRSQEGAELYGLRQHTIEPIFGHTKHNRGFTRFVRRGLSAVNAEWQLIAATNNLLKLHRAGVTRLAII